MLTHRIVSLVSFALMAFSVEANAGSWTTVSQSTDGNFEGYISVTRNGDIYNTVVHDSGDSELLRSTDGGLTWTQLLYRSEWGGEIGPVTEAANGDLVVLVQDEDAWDSLRSSDHGNNWSVSQITNGPTYYNSTSERIASSPTAGLAMTSMYQSMPPNYSQVNWVVARQGLTQTDWTWNDLGRGVGNDVAFTGNGDLFAAGMLNEPDSNEKGHWVVQRSLLGGAWSIVDEVRGEVGSDYAWANSIVTDSKGVIFVGGTRYTRALPNDYGSSWVVRRSLDNGTTWQDFDVVRAADPQGAAEQWYVNSMVIDHEGRLVVTGADYNNGNTLTKRLVTPTDYAGEPVWETLPNPTDKMYGGYLAIDKDGALLLRAETYENYIAKILRYLP